MRHPPKGSLRLSQSCLNSLEIIVAQLSTLWTTIFRNAEQTPALALTAHVRIEDRARASAGFKMFVGSLSKWQCKWTIQWKRVSCESRFRASRSTICSASSFHGRDETLSAASVDEMTG